MDRNEFDRDQRIDPEQLDVECLRQAELFFKWSERACRAREHLEKQKLRLEILEADLLHRCRRKPQRFGLTKSTEGAIAAAVRRSPEYMDASDDLLKAKNDSAILDRAVATMEMKKRMLESLIQLHGQQYFAGPTTPRNLPSEWERKKQAEQRLNQRQIRVVRKRRGAK